MIRTKLKNLSYTSVEEFKQDFKLMFSNAKEYNLVGSQIFEDTVALENVFDKLEKETFKTQMTPKYQENTKVYVKWGDSTWYQSSVEKIRKKVDGFITYRVKYHDGSYDNVSEDHIKVRI
jgi:vancomycin resistance protein YoaR